MWPEDAGGTLRIAPVPQRDGGAAVHQLADFARGARLARLVGDEDLDVRDGLPDGRRTGIDLIRREVGGAKCLGEAVHQIDLDVRMRLSDQPNEVLGKSAPRVRDVPEVGEAEPCEGRVLLRQLKPQRRDPRHARDPFLLERPAHIGGKERALNDKGGSDEKGGEELVEAIVEAEGKQADDSVGCREAQVVRNDLGSGEQVGMAQHDALGEPGRA